MPNVNFLSRYPALYDIASTVGISHGPERLMALHLLSAPCNFTVRIGLPISYAHTLSGRWPESELREPFDDTR